MASTQRNIANAFLQSFEHLDTDANLALRAPGCVHSFAPATLNMPASMTNEQWGAHLNSMKSILSTFPVEAKEIFEHEGSTQVTVWATSNAVFREEAKDAELGLDWNYQGEYIFVLVFNESGDKIERILEFLDSKKVLDFQAQLKRARANVAARTEKHH